MDNKRSRRGLKAQRAYSPGHRPGYIDRREVRPEGAKAWMQNPCILTLLPLQGALYRFVPTQGDALGCMLVGPSARSLNACYPGLYARWAFSPLLKRLLPWAVCSLGLQPAP